MSDEMFENSECPHGKAFGFGCKPCSQPTQQPKVEKLLSDANPIKPQGDDEVNKTIANLTRNMALQSKLYKDLQSERDMLLAEVGELRRQAARAQQPEVEKLQKMLADCIEGFEGHFGPAFWESPLGKRIRAFEESK